MKEHNKKWLKSKSKNNKNVKNKIHKKKYKLSNQKKFNIVQVYKYVYIVCSLPF